MKSISPNLMINNVNKTVDYYHNLPDFELVMSVPEKEKFEWAMMNNGGATIMFQEKGSLAKEIKELQNKPLGATMNLYIQTKNIDALYQKIKQSEKIIKDIDVTLYGTKEFTVEDLNEYILTFAEDNE